MRIIKLHIAADRHAILILSDWQFSLPLNLPLRKICELRPQIIITLVRCTFLLLFYIIIWLWHVTSYLN